MRTVGVNGVYFSSLQCRMPWATVAKAKHLEARGILNKAKNFQVRPGWALTLCNC